MKTLVEFITEKEFEKLPIYQFSMPTFPEKGFQWKFKMGNCWYKGKVTDIRIEDNYVTNYYDYHPIMVYIDRVEEEIVEENPFDFYDDWK